MTTSFMAAGLLACGAFMLPFGGSSTSSNCKDQPPACCSEPCPCEACTCPPTEECPCVPETAKCDLACGADKCTADKAKQADSCRAASCTGACCH